MIHRCLLISLVALIFILPFSKADVVVKEGWVFRTTSNNVRFALGSEVTLYQYIVNNSWIALYKSYREGYYTVYGLEVTSPNNVNLTINTFFATANSSARFTIDAPLSTAIGFSFYSPHLLTATVIGEVAGSETWTAANKTLSFTVNTDTSLTFTISATVTETAETNIPPENLEVVITDMEGCGAWVFSEESYYTFRAKFWDGNGYANLDTCKINFTDGNTWVVAAYDRVTSTWTLESGSDIVNLKAGTLTALDSNTIQVTYLIYFENTILDALDVDIYMWCNDTSGASDGWDLMQTDYFNIYNLGGYGTLETSGDAGRLVGGDVFNLYVNGGLAGEGWAEASFTMRNLQHFKILTSLNMYMVWPYDITVSYFVDYCTDEDDWLEGWGVVLNVTNFATASYRFVTFDVHWLNRGQLVKNETIRIFYEGKGFLWNGSAPFWLDMWFNRINASTTVGARINAYYYPMTDTANPWLRWLTGSNWGIYEDTLKQSMFFTNILDSNGNIISTKEIKMVKVRCKLYVPEDDTYEQYAFLGDYDVFDLTIGTSPMEGIQTPVFDESKVPIMPQGGFLGAVVSWLGRVISKLADFFGPAILGFWNAFVGFLDSVFGFFGWPKGFSTILSWINSLLSWLVSSFTHLISFLTSSFTFLLAVIGKMLNTLSTFVAQWVQIIQNIFSMLSGGLGTGVNIWNSLNLATWVIIIAIFYPIYLLMLWETKGLDAAIGHVKMVMDIFAWIAHIFITVIQLFLNVLGRIIESIPVVE